jgi:hypothetical protein
MSMFTDADPSVAIEVAIPSRRRLCERWAPYQVIPAPNREPNACE